MCHEKVLTTLHVDDYKTLIGKYKKNIYWKVKELHIDRLKYFKNQKQSPEVFCERCVPKNFTKFAGKHLCWSLFFNKVSALLKKRLQHGCFPVNFVKFLRAAFLQTSPGDCL